MSVRFTGEQIVRETFYRLQADNLDSDRLTNVNLPLPSLLDDRNAGQRARAVALRVDQASLVEVAVRHEEREATLGVDVLLAPEETIVVSEHREFPGVLVVDDFELACTDSFFEAADREERNL